MVKKSAIKPIDIESKFFFNELFFSKTDLIGNILTGNSVFVRVSQYSEDELIGSPHNIIRHPDMPRIVFKVLWDYLKAGKIVSAYVKNMTKEGKYYWVLAVVFPVEGGYLSIRLKPSSDYFHLVAQVYKKLLEVEEGGGMNASLTMLLETLKSKGFNDYDSFMSKIMLEELKSRQRMVLSEIQKSTVEQVSLLSKSAVMEQLDQSLIKVLKEISQECRNINEVFVHLFEDFENLQKIEDMTNSTTSSVLNFSDKISMLSLNSSIETYRLGVKGLTLSVISREIKKDSEEIDVHAAMVVNHSTMISSQAQQLGLLTSASRLQSDMINFFGEELLGQARQGKIKETELEIIRDNIRLLVNNFVKTFTEVNNILTPLKGEINDIHSNINIINKIIKNLDRSDVLGSIESSRIGEEGVKFSIVFTQMRELTEITRTKLDNFNKYLKSFVSTIEMINQSNIKILQCVDRIEAVVEKIECEAKVLG